MRVSSWLCFFHPVLCRQSEATASPKKGSIPAVVVSCSSRPYATLLRKDWGEGRINPEKRSFFTPLQPPSRIPTFLLRGKRGDTYTVRTVATKPAVLQREAKKYEGELL